jgi:hypothetical protein
MAKNTTQTETARLYRIKDWSANFENNRTRDMKNMAWVPVPNKHDGDGYTTLVSHENGAAHLGCWLAILQVASRCAERGTLLRDNKTPHNSASLSRITRLNQSLIEEAISRLCSDDIGWLEVVENESLIDNPAPSCGKAAPIPHPTDEEQKGTEQNRTEGKGTEDVEDTFRVCMENLKNDSSFENAIKAVYASNDSFRTVGRMHIENSFKTQPDRLRWHPAIEGMAAKYAGVKMQFPNKTLQNWLAGKPEQATKGRCSI